ncbi:nitroreductase family protein [Thalassotalea sp. LPB0316]|uniref:nitroreductase family protein n=1 Tax=Thalassotalea sp. LPB0316 TaxID=2769490 RepID=UPI001868D8ED|nr:nitroreductase family protein [Thalassotalea sp. LPB0316]QOL25810.1 nitroreductase family protein [Thalassotalea sp. LPB0316]
MSLQQLLSERFSTRAFTEQAVEQATLESIFEHAQLSPSNCNVQPWQVYVVSGEKKEQLKQAFMKALMSGAKPSPEFDWTPQYQGVHRERQFGSANALYTSMGIAREDKQARQMAMVRNWQFFDAPHVAFFTMEKYLNIMGAVDLGIYAQTLSLLMQEQGIASCMQGALGQFPEPVKTLLNIPEERGILFGMSFGYAAKDAPANRTRTERESLANAVSFFD